jgi:competence protein ComEC
VQQWLVQALEDWQVAERGRFVPWLPVFMGAGVLGYFALSSEPPVWLGAALALPAVCAVLLLGHRVVLRAAVMAIAAGSIGFAVAQFATARAPPQPMLPNRAIILTGKVRSVEALPDGQRITLEAVRLADVELGQRWLRLRLKSGDGQDIGTGDTVRLRALVRPPMPPAYPGARDFQRDAWFSGQAGSGYALGKLEHIAQSPPISTMRLVEHLREYIARRISSAVPGPAGAISTALLTGITTGIPPPDHDAFRASGLAHLLAVAGLHIGIVMGWAVAAARFALAASEHASLRWPTKQLAAMAALIIGGAYMVLTGMHVPIVRAFAMACLYTVAVLAGRRAISLRGLALAAGVLMLLAPQEVPGVSFQMSFAAVLALISGYETLRPWLNSLRANGSWRRQFGLYLAALAITSILAGTASAPFGAYHFGRIQLYFVVSNIIAVPIVAFWAMPAGLIGLLLLPFGLDWLAFVPMGWGADAVLYVARMTAAWPAATIDVPHTPPWGLALTGLGVAWLGLWQSKLRLVGVPLIALGFASALLVHPADLMVSSDAKLIAAHIHDAVYLQAVSGASTLTRDAWLQYWAPAAIGFIPANGEVAGGAVNCQKGACKLRPVSKAKAALLVQGISHLDNCRDVSVILSAEPARGLCARPWPALVDRFTVWRYGATAIWLDGRHARIVTDRAYRGNRPWVPPLPTPRARPSPVLPPASADDQ